MPLPGLRVNFERYALSNEQKVRCFTIPANIINWSDNGTFGTFEDNGFAAAKKILFDLFMMLVDMEVSSGGGGEVPVLLVERIAYSGRAGLISGKSIPCFSDRVLRGQVTERDASLLQQYIQSTGCDDDDTPVSPQSRRSRQHQTCNASTVSVYGSSESDVQDEVSLINGGDYLQMEEGDDELESSPTEHQNVELAPASGKHKTVVDDIFNTDADTNSDSSSDSNVESGVPWPSRRRRTSAVRVPELDLDEVLRTNDDIFRDGNGACAACRLWFICSPSTTVDVDDVLKAICAENNKEQVGPYNYNIDAVSECPRGGGDYINGDDSMDNEDQHDVDAHGRYAEASLRRRTSSATNKKTAKSGRGKSGKRGADVPIPSILRDDALKTIRSLNDVLHCMEVAYGSGCGLEDLFDPRMDIEHMSLGDQHQRDACAYFLSEDHFQTCIHFPYPEYVTLMHASQASYRRIYSYSVPCTLRAIDAGGTRSSCLRTVATGKSNSCNDTIQRGSTAMNDCLLPTEDGSVDQDAQRSADVLGLDPSVHQTSRDLRMAQQEKAYAQWVGASDSSPRLAHAFDCRIVIEEAQRPIRQLIIRHRQNQTLRKRHTLLWHHIDADLHRIRINTRALYMGLRKKVASAPQARALRVIDTVLREQGQSLCYPFTRVLGNVSLFTDFVVQTAVWCKSIKGIVSGTRSFLLHFCSGLTAGSNASQSGLHIMTTGDSDSGKSFILDLIAQVFPSQVSTMFHETALRDARSGNQDGEIIQKNEFGPQEMGVGVFRGSDRNNYFKDATTNRVLQMQGLVYEDGVRSLQEETLYALRVWQGCSNVRWNEISEAVRSRFYRNYITTAAPGADVPNMYQSMARARCDDLKGVRQSIDRFLQWLTAMCLDVHFQIDAGLLDSVQLPMISQYWEYIEADASRFGLWGKRTTMREFDRVRCVVSALTVMNAVLRVFTCPHSTRVRSPRAGHAEATSGQETVEGERGPSLAGRPHEAVDYALLEPYLIDALDPSIMVFAMNILKDEWVHPAEYDTLKVIRATFFNRSLGGLETSATGELRTQVGDGDNVYASGRAPAPLRTSTSNHLRALLSKHLLSPSGETGADTPASISADTFEYLHCRLTRFRNKFTRGRHRAAKERSASRCRSGRKRPRAYPPCSDSSDVYVDGDAEDLSSGETEEQTTAWMLLVARLLDGKRATRIARLASTQKEHLYQGIVDGLTDCGFDFYDWLLQHVSAADGQPLHGSIDRVLGDLYSGHESRSAVLQEEGENRRRDNFQQRQGVHNTATPRFGGGCDFIVDDESDSDEEYGHLHMDPENVYTHPGQVSAFEALRRVVRAGRKLKESHVWYRQLEDECTRVDPMEPSTAACYFSTRIVTQSKPHQEKYGVGQHGGAGGGGVGRAAARVEQTGHGSGGHADDGVPSPPPSAPGSAPTPHPQQQQQQATSLRTYISTLTDHLMFDLKRKGHSRELVMEILFRLYAEQVEEEVTLDVQPHQQYLDVHKTGRIARRLQVRKLSFDADGNIRVARSLLKRLAVRDVMMEAFRRTHEHRKTTPFVALGAWSTRNPNLPRSICFIPRNRDPPRRRPLGKDTTMHADVLLSQQVIHEKAGDVAKILRGLQDSRDFLQSPEEFVEEHLRKYPLFSMVCETEPILPRENTLRVRREVQTQQTLVRDRVFRNVKEYAGETDASVTHAMIDTFARRHRYPLQPRAFPFMLERTPFPQTRRGGTHGENCDYTLQDRAHDALVRELCSEAYCDVPYDEVSSLAEDTGKEEDVEEEVEEEEEEENNDVHKGVGTKVDRRSDRKGGRRRQGRRVVAKRHRRRLSTTGLEEDRRRTVYFPKKTYM